MNFLAAAAQGPWINLYLKILAIALGCSALIHLSSGAGWSGTRRQLPVVWRLTDIAFLGLDVWVAVGLWRQRGWAILLLLLAMASRGIIYTACVDVFAPTARQRLKIYRLLGTEAAAIAGFGLLLLRWWLENPDASA